MSHELTVLREHLAINRRTIIGRSIASALAGSLPVPLLDDWLASAIRRSLVRRVADSHGVDITADAVIAIADGKSSPPTFAELFGSAVAFKVLSKSFRKLLLTYVTARRAQVAARNFAVATLFDHYCARLHVGLGLNAEQAHELRELIVSAIDRTPGSLGGRLFRRGLTAAARASMRAPVELLDVATGGAVRRYLSSGDEVDAIAEIDSALDVALHKKSSFLGKAAAGIEMQVSAEMNPYIEKLLTVFEQMWRVRSDEQDT